MDHETLRSDLLAAFRLAVEESSPARLARSIELSALPPRFDLVVAGKCAATFFDAIAESWPWLHAFVSTPRGYGEPHPRGNVELAQGTHPELSAESFEAGRRLQRFVRECSSPLVVILSGGSSASLEVPLPWVSDEELISIYQKLYRCGLSIREMNVVRKHLSAIKGGRLVETFTNDFMTFVISDVEPGDLSTVGSGPTLADPSTNFEAAELGERIGVRGDIVHRLRDSSTADTPKKLAGSSELLADNFTLQRMARASLADRGYRVRAEESQLTGTVEEAADEMLRIAASLHPGEVAITGGEPTVKVSGNGRGGRCSELAVHVALGLQKQQNGEIVALFAGSDGLDGTSGMAGVLLDPARLAAAAADKLLQALRESDSISVAHTIGEPIRIQPTGNNLRDLYFLART